MEKIDMDKWQLILLGFGVVALHACSVFSGQSSRVLYDQSINDTTKIKIRYALAHSRGVFSIRSFVNGKPESNFEISDMPDRFVIVKRNANVESNYNYVVLSDTSNGQLKYIDYFLLSQHQTELVKQSFIRITESEISYFMKLDDIIKAKKIDFRFSKEDVIQMKGWVKLYY